MRIAAKHMEMLNDNLESVHAAYSPVLELVSQLQSLISVILEM